MADRNVLDMLGAMGKYAKSQQRPGTRPDMPFLQALSTSLEARKQEKIQKKKQIWGAIDSGIAEINDRGKELIKAGQIDEIIENPGQYLRAKTAKREYTPEQYQEMGLEPMRGKEGKIEYGRPYRAFKPYKDKNTEYLLKLRKEYGKELDSFPDPDREEWLKNELIMIGDAIDDKVKYRKPPKTIVEPKKETAQQDYDNAYKMLKNQGIGDDEIKKVLGERPR